MAPPPLRRDEPAIPPAILPLEDDPPIITPASTPLKRWFHRLGPGLITGASDDDPSGIGTYATAGAALGYATLWTAIVTLPLMVVVQFLCAKVGLVRGRGLAGVLQRHYPRSLLYPVVFCLVIANTINAGTDLGAIAAGINLLIPVPIQLLILPVALGLVALQLWGSYRLLTTVFKWLTLSLLTYIVAAFLAKPHWPEVLKATFLPPLRVDHDYLLTLVAILGTTISPYLFFWQASEEVEAQKSQGRSPETLRHRPHPRLLERTKWDTLIGMVFCNLVFYFVILATAATLHATGQTTIQSAAKAAQALRPVAGDAATVLFAMGMIGAGVLAVPVLTGSSAYAVAETFRWHAGLNAKPQHAKAFYTVIAVSTLIGSGINFLGINPITALFWTAVINGVLAPPVLVILLLITSNPRLMDTQVNGRLTQSLGWLTALLMLAAALGMLLTSA